MRDVMVAAFVPVLLDLVNRNIKRQLEMANQAAVVDQIRQALRYGRQQVGFADDAGKAQVTRHLKYDAPLSMTAQHFLDYGVSRTRRCDKHMAFGQVIID